MSIFIDDVDVLHEEYKASGAIIRMPPTNLPWQTREMNVIDLDGHCFRMGSEPAGAVDPEGVKRLWELEQLDAK
jgi:uncharacterized glyoxalase superfamily protein PhnB